MFFPLKKKMRVGGGYPPSSFCISCLYINIVSSAHTLAHKHRHEHSVQTWNWKILIQFFFFFFYLLAKYRDIIVTRYETADCLQIYREAVVTLKRNVTWKTTACRGDVIPSQASIMLLFYKNSLRRKIC